jgi:hypothetical protein
MRTRSCTAGLAVFLGSFCFVALASPASLASAAPKKKKAAAAAEAEAPPAEEKEQNVDDLMEQGAAPKKKSASSSSESSAASEGSAEEEEAFVEPDAWERPPVEEEKPKPVAPKAVEEKYGDGNRIEIGLAPGFGIKAGDADWTGMNPYGLGLGIRGGYELDFKMFIGAGFVYHLGSSESRNTAPAMANPVFIETSVNYMLAYAEVGYDLWYDRLLLRPSLWLGMGFAIADPYQNLGRQMVSDFMLAPGLNLIYIFDGIYIGADIRYVAVTADGLAGLNFFGVVGLRF